MGIVNIGGPGRVEAAGQGWDMANGDVLYLGMGAGAVTFSGGGRFYITSAPAHRAALPHPADHRRSGQEGRDGHDCYL